MPLMARADVTNSGGGVAEPSLERSGKRLGHSATWFLAVAVPFIIVGIVLIIVDKTWSLAFGGLALLIGLLPGVVGVGLVVSSVIARWSARHKSFA